jgi:hypothetical protein
MDRITAKHAFAVAMLALFVALGGSAAALDGSNTVFTDDITNGEVKSADIGDGAVKAPDIGADQVRISEVADNAVGAGEFFPFANDEIVDGSVDGQDVNEQSLDLRRERVEGSSELDSTSSKDALAECPPGKLALGSGAEINGGQGPAFPNTQTQVAIREIVPFSRGASVLATEVGGGTSSDWSVTAYAVCVGIAG